MHTYIHTYSISPVTVRPRWGVEAELTVILM